MKSSVVYPFLLALAGCASDAQDFATERLQRHIRVLSDDSFQGRGTGTAGEAAAADYIISEFARMGLAPKGDDGSYRQKFPFSSGIHGADEPGTAVNVIGYLDNQAEHTVVIGAHYDHLGVGGAGGSLDADPGDKIHNGADDNASGVSGVMELARYFSSNGIREKNNFLFACFSGEELGLLGSKYFTGHLGGQEGRINYMINMDMIGRLDSVTRTVIVYGTGTSPSWEPVLQKLETENLKIDTDSSGTGPSDHTSFYLRDIPVLHFFTGAHNDYHKPTDDWEKINLDGQAEILRLIARVIEGVDYGSRLTFLKTRSKPQAARSAFKVTLGIMPSYVSRGDGLKVDGVTEGRPAHNAGIQTGDVIVQMGDYPVRDIEQYMEALGKFEKGQRIPLKVKRDGKMIHLKVTF